MIYINQLKAKCLCLIFFFVSKMYNDSILYNIFVMINFISFIIICGAGNFQFEECYTQRLVICHRTENSGHASISHKVHYTLAHCTLYWSGKRTSSTEESQTWGFLTLNNLMVFVSSLTFELFKMTIFHFILKRSIQV